MVRDWAMAPAEYGPRGTKWATFWKCWQYNLEHGVIAIGWDLGEAPESKEHLAWLWENYARPKWPNREHGLRMLSYFWFDIEPGDTVVARAGLTRYVGLGEFRGEPFYDQEADGLSWGCSFRCVEWGSPTGVRNSPVRFSQNTLYPLKPDKAALFGL